MPDLPVAFSSNCSILSSMILPSDSDPPDRNEGKDDPPWWKSPDLSNSDGEDDNDETADHDDFDESDADDPDDPQFPPPDLASMAGPGWRKELYKDLIDSLIQLDAIEDPDADFTPPEPPDLYTFYGELAALRNELQRQGQQSNESLSLLTKNLIPATNKGKPARSSVAGPKTDGAADTLSAAPWPVGTCLSLLSLWDLLPRPAASEAVFHSLFDTAGLTRIFTADQPFDPATMTLAGCEKSPGKAPHLVLREITAGFFRDGSLLRPAVVVVTS